MEHAIDLFAPIPAPDEVVCGLEMERGARAPRALDDRAQQRMHRNLLVTRGLAQHARPFTRSIAMLCA